MANKLADQLRAIASAMESGAYVDVAKVQAFVDELTNSAVASSYPRVEDVHGVKMKLLAPLNPLYKPGMSAYIFGTYGGQVYDPSNGASVGKPIRSAGGFPLSWATLPDPTNPGKLTAVGNPMVNTHDHTFDTDDQAVAFIESQAKSPAEIARIRDEWVEWGKRRKG